MGTLVPPGGGAHEVLEREPEGDSLEQPEGRQEEHRRQAPGHGSVERHSGGVACPEEQPEPVGGIPAQQQRKPERVRGG